MAKHTEISRFALIPRMVLHAAAFAYLNGSAIKLLIVLASQYNGHNNGDLCASAKILREFGFTSHDTINRALKQLLKYGFIVKTRESQFRNGAGRCCLYALAWQNIDECKGKLDVGPTSKPPGNFKLKVGKSGKMSGAFAQIPLYIIKADAFIQLKGRQAQVLLIIASAYRPQNNNRIMLGRADFKKCGMRCHATIDNSIKRLEQLELIAIEHRGMFDPQERSKTCFSLCWR
ncbi:hypothetical protein GCM10011297_10510 [Bacterioplanes sanyensis]|uniref:hypothetical protein n=1 Tax=Bacterioplanes sanyensis TaxID=1249553 RepID=UPI0016782763|nr:hypothetical protein [Bacterioplanes sanyensis]GGY39204.1 hypothetical protein GCM10011297_10510 [Bacterioplanes sanyensis]